MLKQIAAIVREELRLAQEFPNQAVEALEGVAESLADEFTDCDSRAQFLQDCGMCETSGSGVYADPDG